MLLSMVVSLYTSRVVLNTLGVEDYGIYNVVAGVVVMFSFLNAGMIAASQRFISFELGTKNVERLKDVFTSSVLIHLCIALTIFIIAETLGLWFVNTKLNIENSRLIATNWVYQCSIFSFLMGVISVPYSSCIVAHEKMKAFAYIGLLDVCLKLIIVYILVLIEYDKLKLYSLLVTVVSIVIQIIYIYYCRYNFVECRYRFVFDKKLLREMFVFASWSFIGNLGFSFKDQGSNIILNIFCGTTVNAARGIAYQVSGVINNFSSNFLMALNPQITKAYAKGNILYMTKLISKGCRYSFYLLSIIIIPVFVKIEYLIDLWLVEVPYYTYNFLRLSLIISIINSMANPLVVAIQATGRIRDFQIIIAIVMLLDLPLYFLLLKNNYVPYSVMYISISTSIIGLFIRVWLMSKLIPYNIKFFFIHIFCKNMILFGLSLLSCFCFNKYISSNYIGLIFSLLLYFIIVVIIFYIFGLDKEEQLFLKNKITTLYNKYKLK